MLISVKISSNEIIIPLWLWSFNQVKNTRLVFSQGIDPFSNTKEVLQLPASACPLDRVVIQGRGYVSTEALERLAESNINVIMLDKRGKLYSYY